MAYREADAEAQERAEAELVAREAIEPLVEEGRARREGRPVQALVPAPRRFPLLSVAQVRRIVGRLPRDWARDAQVALREQGHEGWYEGAAVVAGASTLLAWLATPALALVTASVAGTCAAMWRRSRFELLRREVSWAMSLPFDLHGYLEVVPLLEEHAFAFDVDVDPDVELGPEGLAMVADLVERVRDEHEVSVEAKPGGVTIAFARPIPPRLAHHLADEVLVPLHGLHRITHVGVRRVTQPREEHEHHNVVRRRSR